VFVEPEIHVFREGRIGRRRSDLGGLPVAVLKLDAKCIFGGLSAFVSADLLVADRI